MSKKSDDTTNEEKQHILRRWMTPTILEEELGIKIGNQHHMRREKRIPYVKAGSYIFYDRKKIDAWLEAHEIDVAS